MQQHGQLSRRGNDGAFLPVPPRHARQFQAHRRKSPSAQRAQNVMRTLPSKFTDRIALVDVLLRLALAGLLRPVAAPVSSPRPALAKTCASSSVSGKVSAINVPTPFTCFSGARADSSRARPDPLVAFADAFTQRLIAASNGSVQFVTLTQPFRLLRIHIAHVHLPSSP